MPGENVEIVRRAFEAVGRGDLDGFLALMDSEVVAIPRIVAIEGGSLSGHDGIRRWWDGVFSAFPDFQVEIGSVRGTGDATVSEVRITGHGQGSGAPFEDAVWVAARVRDGKVSWWQTFLSEAEALEAAGLSE